MVRRMWASSRPAAAGVAWTVVPTSICDLRNSGATCPGKAACAASKRPGGRSRTRSRLARSTRRYSSSMPMLNEGSLSAMAAHGRIERSAPQRAPLAPRGRQRLARHPGGRGFPKAARVRAEEAEVADAPEPGRGRVDAPQNAVATARELLQHMSDGGGRSPGVIGDLYGAQGSGEAGEVLLPGERRVAEQEIRL